MVHKMISLRIWNCTSHVWLHMKIVTGKIPIITHPNNIPWVITPFSVNMCLDWWLNVQLGNCLGCTWPRVFVKCKKKKKKRNTNSCHAYLFFFTHTRHDSYQLTMYWLSAMQPFSIDWMIVGCPAFFLVTTDHHYHCMCEEDSLVSSNI